MKKILFSLLCLIGLSSFCSAGQYTFQGNSVEGVPSMFIIPQKQYDNNVSLHCEFVPVNFTCGGGDWLSFKLYFYGFRISNHTSLSNSQIGSQYSISCDNPQSIIIDYDFSTFTPPGGYFASMYGVAFLELNSLYYAGTDGVHNVVDYSCTFSGQYVLNSCQTCSPQYTSEECQSEYGLVSSGVLNQCNNNLQSCQASLSGRNNTLNNCSNNLLSCESSLASCIQSNCPIDTGSVMWSSIWINGIQHLGKPVINIDIPDQIYWQYTTDDEEFNLYVGSGYDQEYIDNVIAVNSYHPTSEDFTSVFVSGLTLIMPYIFIALLILFIRKLVKRIFK